MKKLLIKLSFIIVPFVVLLLLLNYRYMNSYYFSAYPTERKHFEHIPQEIQLANLGSSHGADSFDYEDFPEYATFNFGVPAQHHKYNYYVLRQYVDFFAQDSVLLIPISYFDITRIDSVQ